MFTMSAANAHEFKRWLTKQGVTFGPAKGSQSILPMHNVDLKTGTVEGIKKQLGLKGK